MTLSRRQFFKSTLFLTGAILLNRRTTVAARFIPAYRKLNSSGKLKERVEAAYEIFESCRLCPRQCGANRAAGELGFCRTSAKAKIYSAHPHLGEEKSLVGRHGSGTIFFSNCNLRCIFCQNWPIAHKGYGKEINDSELADIMLSLQDMGCHNINLVTPTHVMPNILNGVRIACSKGLNIPLVYNTSGYERVQILKLLDAVIDIYLPDMKYMDPSKAAQYSSGASDYPAAAKSALLEMQRQVGGHRTDDEGAAIRGLMIRHLVMPNRVAGTERFVAWVAKNLPKSTYVNIMGQYHVAFRAFEYPEIWRRITVKEYLDAMQAAENYGLTHLDPDAVRLRDFYRRQ